MLTCNGTKLLVIICCVCMVLGKIYLIFLCLVNSITQPDHSECAIRISNASVYLVTAIWFFVVVCFFLHFFLLVVWFYFDRFMIWILWNHNLNSKIWQNVFIFMLAYIFFLFIFLPFIWSRALEQILSLNSKCLKEK